MQVYGKMNEPLGFQMQSDINSYVEYQGYKLYYDKFRKDTFASLADQYKKITKQALVLNFNGLILDPSL